MNRRPTGMLMRISLMVLLGIGLPVSLPAAESLPASPEFKGEIRRNAEGRLEAVTSTVRRSNTEETTAPAATMRVGPQQKITTLTEAARQARDGDVIEIASGDYRGQPVVWTQNNLVLRGATPRPVVIGDGKSAEGKALWVVRGGTIRIENIEFRGARVADANGAGIRFEAGHLHVHHCAFFDNEMGILTANRPELTLTVSDSEFGSAPATPGDLHHLLYVGAIGRFTLTGSRFENGYLGHLVKSRARENDIRYNWLIDGSEGRASYELEFPNGGIAYVIGNLIGQGERSDNPVIVSYGAEGPRWPENALYFAHNTLANERPAGGEFLKVWRDKFPSPIETWAINNLLIGPGELKPPAQGRFEGNLTATHSELSIFGGHPLRLVGNSALRGAVRIPGQADHVELLPAEEFVFPAGRRPIQPGSRLTPGALQ